VNIALETFSKKYVFNFGCNQNFWLKEGVKGILKEVALSNSCCAFKKNDSAYLLSKLTEAESLASPYKGVSS